MQPIPPSIGRFPRRRAGTAAVAVVALGAVVLSGCGAISAAKKIEHDVRGNKATIDAFTGKIQSAAATPFVATYATTGSSPATVVYAVDPPKNLAFTDTPSSGGTGVHFIANSSGDFVCTPTASAGTSCQKLAAGSASTERDLIDLYTPAHWVAFLQDFSLAAGIAGDQVTSSSMTVNGFALQCVNFATPGQSGTSTICTTAQGILGYVKVADDSTSFEITNYSASPPASLFVPPPGATITTVPATNS